LILSYNYSYIFAQILSYDCELESGNYNTYKYSFFVHQKHIIYKVRTGIIYKLQTYKLAS